jgi:hypothetical protein
MGFLARLKTFFWGQYRTDERSETAPSSARLAALAAVAGSPATKQHDALSTEPGYVQKRHYKRFAVQHEGISARFVLADVIELSNISTGGACIVTTGTLNPGDSVLLRLPKEKVSIPLKCTVIWEQSKEVPEEATVTGNVQKAGLRFSDVDSGTLVRLKDFMRSEGTPCDRSVADHFRPGPLRFGILSGEKAVLNYPATFPVKKISLGGMVVETTSDFAPGQHYHMALYLPHNNRPVKFLGRVASSILCNDSFDIGIEFIGMHEADHIRLQSFIETLTASN